MPLHLLAAASFASAMLAASVSIQNGSAVVAGASCPSLTVRVRGAAGGLLGECTASAGKLTFTPRFPFQPGVAYEAVLGTEVTPFEIPKPAAERTHVVAVYPSADRIPDNQLKFYVQFSAPMSRGEVYKRVRLINQRGEQERFAFLELDQELWNRETTRVTLLFDPGRVKRGVKPNRDDGVPLRVGERYRFVVDAAWPDGNANALEAGFEKSFTVVASDREPIDPEKWRIAAPKAGTRDPLVIRFGEPLDRAMLDSALRVAGVEGAVASRARETEWAFTPATPWRPGSYVVETDTMLEDLAGNKIGREFDIDINDGKQRQLERVWMKLPFRVQ